MISIAPPELLAEHVYIRAARGARRTGASAPGAAVARTAVHA